ncbi:MAG: Peptidyl-tRNA hydrolase [uncultured bacterium]|nr:MAG: Peptidyl-tRNA hydrolase [uncultured bacterium]
MQTINIKKIKLIIGLGNPGKKYENTRHNIGAKIAGEIGALPNLNLSEFNFNKNFNAIVAEGIADDKKIIVCLPQFFMNECGKSVASVANFHKIKTEEILVIHDDINLKLGEVKRKTEGSAGGHNGLRSIIQGLGSDKFARIRIGIGRPMSEKPKTPEEEELVAKYVLSNFSKKELEILEKQKQEILNQLTP